MFNSYDNYIDSPVSEKIILAHVHAVKRLYNFEVAGANYSRHVPYFVVGVRNGVTGEDLTPVENPELVDNTKFHYDPTESKLYIKEYDQVESEIIVTYRFFFSNVPINLSWDLKDNSHQVEYQPRIDNSPMFKSYMAQGKKGISLIGSGNLNLINQDKGLNSIYDSLIWDNKEVNIYSFHRDLNPSEARCIFRGIVAGKSFASGKVNFAVKDTLYALEARVPLEQYGDLTREED